MTAPQQHRRVLLEHFPARRMWDWRPGTDGYCGEVCFQMALAKFGANVSAEMTHAATGGEELLLGVNDVRAAQALLLHHEFFASEYDNFPLDDEDGETATNLVAAFGTFVRFHVDRGGVVVFGLYAKLPHGQGDSDYDHIMPVCGYEEEVAVKNPRVTKIFYYDLWSQETRALDLSKDVGPRESFWFPKNPNRNKRGQPKEPKPPQPWEYGLTLMKIYAVALTGLTHVAPPTATPNPFPAAQLSLALQVPYFEEPDFRDGGGDGGHLKPMEYHMFAKKKKLLHDEDSALHGEQEAEEFTLVAIGSVDAARAVITLLTGRQFREAPSAKVRARMQELHNRFFKTSVFAAAASLAIPCGTGLKPPELRSVDTAFFLFVPNSRLREVMAACELKTKKACADCADCCE